MSNHNYRLYSFVAGLYLNELQKGLQTAHVIGDLAAQVVSATPMAPEAIHAFRAWASTDKTIIILNALNHGGVVQLEGTLAGLATGLGLPCATFREDEVSMNGMATAVGIVVPEKYYNAVPYYERLIVNGEWVQGKLEGWAYSDPDACESAVYALNTAEGQLVSTLKNYRLA